MRLASSADMNGETPYCIVLTTVSGEEQAQTLALAQFIRVHHTYEVPEIVQIAVAAGSTDYFQWIDEGTRSGDNPPR